MANLDLLADLLRTGLAGANIPAHARKLAIDQACACRRFIEFKSVGGSMRRRRKGLKLLNLPFGSARQHTGGIELAQQGLHLRFLRGELLENLAAFTRLGSLWCRGLRESRKVGGLRVAVLDKEPAREIVRFFQQP
jgi:hypothetical protein